MTQKVLTTGIASGDEINWNFTKLFNKVGSNMSLDEYEVDKTGVNSSVRAISNFVADVGTGKANLPMAPGIYLIDRDYTIPSNVNIVPEMGAVFYIASGVTLTVNGGIDAGLWQIFSGDGSVVGNPKITEIYPEWFGAIGGLSTPTEDSGDAFAGVMVLAESMQRCIIKCTKQYRIINRTYYINPTVVTNITLEAVGFASKIYLEGYVDKFLFSVNEDENGDKYVSYPGSDKLCFKNIMIDGGASTSAKLAKYRQTGCNLSNVKFQNMYYGVVSEGYCDNIKMEHIDWFYQRLDGYCGYFTKGEDGSCGDSAQINQIMCYTPDTGYIQAIYMSWGADAIISGINGGQVKLSNSKNINIKSSHLEFSGYAPSIHIANSIVNIESNFLYNNNNRPGEDNFYGNNSGFSPIEINDSGTRGSIVTIKNNTFQRQVDNYITARKNDINIVNLKNDSKIFLENNRTFLNSGENYCYTGVLVGAESFDPTVNTRIFKNTSILHKNVCIKKNNYVWQVYDISQENIYNVLKLIKPVVSGSVVDSYHDSLVADTYYYKVVSYTLGLRHSESSDEISVEKSTDENTSCILLQTTSTSDAFLVVYRGTTTGVYDKIAIIPNCNENIKLHDTGNQLGGYAYVDPSTFPWGTTPSTKNSTGNGTYNIFTDVSETTVDAIPNTSADSNEKGDIVNIKVPVFGEAMQYICTTGGSPGNWHMTKQFGVAKNLSGSRPTANFEDIGLSYYDTTLVATEGKPIFWNGLKWIDATGAEA